MKHPIMPPVPTPVLHRYLYVEARDVSRDLDVQLSFDSIQIDAEDDEDAYQRGFTALDAYQREHEDLTGHTLGLRLNDYVVQIS